jgi:hypothetical protein
VLTSTSPPLHSVKGPKEWLVASPPDFQVEEHAEPRRIHIEDAKPAPIPEPIPEPHHESHHEPRHEARHETRPEAHHVPKHEPKHEPRHEKRHEPKPKLADDETVTRPAPKSKAHFLHRAHRTVLRHLRRDKSQPAEPGDKELLWMVATALGSVCVGLMIWGAYSTLPRPGGGYGGLRADAGSPKLKVVTGDYGAGRVDPRRRTSEPPPVLTGLHPPPPSHVPPGPAPTPPADHKKVPDPPRFSGPAVPDAKMPFDRTIEALPRRVDPSIFVKANLGETPMIRTWDNLAKYSMMLTALAATPALPVMPQAYAQPPLQQLPAPPQAPGVDYSKQIADLTQAVKSLTADVNRLKDIDEKIDSVRTEVSKQIAKIKIEPHDDTELLKKLVGIQGEILKLSIRLDNLPAAAAAGPGVAAAPASTSRIESVLVSIHEAILKLRPNDRVALSPPDLPAPALPAKSARVILVNLYDKDLWLWVNDKVHRVAKQTTFTLENVTPGATKIEVKSQDETYHRVSPSLVANETYTLTAR